MAWRESFFVEFLTLCCHSLLGILIIKELVFIEYIASKNLHQNQIKGFWWSNYLFPWYKYLHLYDVVWLQWIHYYLARSELSHPSVLVYCEIYVLDCLWVVIIDAIFSPSSKKKLKNTPRKNYLYCRNG